jgi:N-carbamoylputrescine amidase
VSDPFGVVLTQGSENREEVLVARCDRPRLDDVRRNWPFFRDRRIDAYGDLTRRWLR